MSAARSGDRPPVFRFQYDNELDQQRAAALSWTVLLAGGLVLVTAVFLPLLRGGGYFRAGNIVYLAFSLGSLLSYWLIRARRLRLASLFFVTLLFALATFQFGAFGLSARAVVVGMAAVILASYLLGTAGMLSAALYLAALVILAAYLGVRGARLFPLPLEVQPGSAQWMILDVIQILTFLLVLVAVLGFQARGLLRYARTVQRTARQLETAAVVSETAAAATSLSDLLNLVVERIREAYGFYHAQVFLLDQEGRMARLQASTGRAGEALLARGHALPVGSQSVVGQCSARRIPIVVNDTLRSETHRPNELLPDTRAELALPLMIGSDVIGVLDVQSTEANVFSADDVRSLQVMAGQLATAIDKARLVDQLQARAIENQRLFEETQRNLRQVEELTRRLTREGWADYLQTRRAARGLGYTLHGEKMQRDTSWTSTMRQAYQGEHSVVVRQDRNAHIAAIPVVVRGEVIGVLEVERGGGRHWRDDEIEMAEALVQRLALALENARLYEQATLAATREQIVNQIAQDVQQAETIDEVLQAALVELSSVLGASRGVVQISPRESAGPGGGSPAALADGRGED